MIANTSSRFGVNKFSSLIVFSLMMRMQKTTRHTRTELLTLNRLLTVFRVHVAPTLLNREPHHPRDYLRIRCRVR